MLRVILRVLRKPVSGSGNASVTAENARTRRATDMSERARGRDRVRAVNGDCVGLELDMLHGRCGRAEHEGGRGEEEVREEHDEVVE